MNEEHEAGGIASTLIERILFIGKLLQLPSSRKSTGGTNWDGIFQMAKGKHVAAVDVAKRLATVWNSWSKVEGVPTLYARWNQRNEIAIKMKLDWLDSPTYRSFNHISQHIAFLKMTELSFIKKKRKLFHCICITYLLIRTIHDMF